MFPIALGGVQWSLADHLDDDAAVSCIRAAVDAGVTLIDTAYAYTTLDQTCHNESLVRRALADHPDREHVLIATKGGHWRRGENDFPIDARPETLRRHLEASLRALDMEAVDLYQLHHPDPAVPLAESIGALADMKIEGKIRAIGVSNLSLDQIDIALSVTEVVSVQNEFSPLQASDAELVAALAERGIAFMAYSPLGGRRRVGQLSALLPHAAAVAAARGLSVQSVVLAWMLAVSPNLIPVVGAARTPSILDSVSAADLQLSSSELTSIDSDVARISD